MSPSLPQTFFPGSFVQAPTTGHSLIMNDGTFYAGINHPEICLQARLGLKMTLQVISAPAHKSFTGSINEYCPMRYNGRKPLSCLKLINKQFTLKFRRVVDLLLKLARNTVYVVIQIRT
jgi:hypothetical protein